MSQLMRFIQGEDDNLDEQELAAKKSANWVLWIILGVFVVFIAWAALTQLDRTVRGQGRVVPSSKLQVVSNLEGGVVEEIIARWGLLTGFMALAMRLGRGRDAAFWIANAAAALLFALGHFGALFAMVPHPSLALMAAVLLGNFVPAMGFGWLYRQHGIESAMLAHGGAHMLFAALAASGLVA